jgi:hypothetical protein
MLSERLVSLLRGSYQTVNGGRRKARRALTKLRRFTEKEVLTWEKRWLSMPLRRRLWLWRHGFLSQADVLYDLDEDSHRRYFSDFQRERAYWINDEQRSALNNKLFFHWMMEPFDDQRVATYGLLKRGRFHDLQSLRPAADGGGITCSDTARQNTVNAAEWVTERLREEGELMLKPWRGSDGMDVMRCSYDDGSYAVDGEERSASAFESMVDGLDGYLVSEVIEQAAYAAEMFPGSANTIRALTMYDDEADEPFLPVAAHRIGTERSAPLDNFSSGGLAAEVDRETGRLTAASQFPYSGSLDWHDTHPDTGARIEGRTIPGWGTIRDQLLDMAATFSHTPYIGWDVVVTDDGEFTVIEGNSCSGVRVFQVHQPLLDNDRVRRFYERHGVVPADE